MKSAQIAVNSVNLNKNNSSNMPSSDHCCLCSHKWANTFILYILNAELTMSLKEGCLRLSL